MPIRVSKIVQLNVNLVEMSKAEGKSENDSSTKNLTVVYRGIMTERQAGNIEINFWMWFSVVVDLKENATGSRSVIFNQLNKN